MSLRAWWWLLRVELLRTRGALVGAGVGVVLGTAVLTFFLALGLGARAVLLGEVFPVDRLVLEPPRTEAGLLSLLGGRQRPPGVSADTIASLQRLPGVRAVSPRLRFQFPSMARGGRELLGREIGTHEMLGDGIDPGLVEPALRAAFQDPWTSARGDCTDDGACPPERYCERPSGAAAGRCSDPVPGLVSRYLVEVFDHGVAPAHGLPPIAGTLLARAEGVTFELTLGTSLLGHAPVGSTRKVKVRVVGVSPEAIDLGVTLPAAVVERWNREYTGLEGPTEWSSVVVQVASARDAAEITSEARGLGLVLRDTRARDVSVLVNAVLALLLLVAGAVLLVATLDIAHTFRSWVHERTPELALHRALGASRSDILRLVLGLALSTGVLGGLAGALVARLAAAVVDWRAAMDLPDFPFKPASFFAFPPWLFALAVGFGALATLLGATGNAWAASRSDPAATLQGR